MATNSTEAGFLLPTSPEPIYDDPLDDVVHDLIAGVTGIPPTHVRPRWQHRPPGRPSVNTEWCAFGVQNLEADVDPYITNQLANDKIEDVLVRTEIITYLLSFYGDQALHMARRFKDGVCIQQNRQGLLTVGASLLECLQITPVPALLNEQWCKRMDLPVVLRRTITRTYPVRSLQSAEVQITTEELGVSTNL